MRQLFPPPTYELPNELLFEVTGEVIGDAPTPTSSSFIRAPNRSDDICHAGLTTFRSITLCLRVEITASDERRVQMPVAYIDLPSGLGASTKTKLVKDVAELIHHAYLIPDARVSLREWPAEQTSVDGELGHQPMRPICAFRHSGRAAIRRQRQARRASQLRNRRGARSAARAPSASRRQEHQHEVVLGFFSEYPLDQ